MIQGFDYVEWYLTYNPGKKMSFPLHNFPLLDYVEWYLTRNPGRKKSFPLQNFPLLGFAKLVGLLSDILREVLPVVRFCDYHSRFGDRLGFSPTV